jgi:hypothetical protein
MVDGELEEPRTMGADCGVDQIRSAEERRVDEHQSSMFGREWFSRTMEVEMCERRAVDGTLDAAASLETAHVQWLLF